MDADVAASVAAAAEARTDRAIAVGLPGIVRGDHVTYLDGDAIRRGTFERVAVYGYGTGSRFRFDHYEVVVATTDGGAVSVDPALVERADAPALPACAGFVGTGRRCGTCRIHRNIHN